MAQTVSKTLIIGLGGTSKSVIRDIKKKLLCEYGEIPTMIKFLSIDTEDDDYQDTFFKYYYGGEYRETKKYNLQKDEIIKLQCPNIDLLKNDVLCKNLNFRELSKTNYKNTGSQGPNDHIANRVWGRALFLFHSGQIMSALRKMVFDLRRPLSVLNQVESGNYIKEESITAYVISSLAGATGSSAIMDISRMLQHAGINLKPDSVAVDADRIIGLFFSPSFYNNSTAAQNISINANAYVALSELDYTLSLNDMSKYTEGCQELDNDLNCYEGYNTYKSVQYSKIFLIGANTQNGHSISFEDASANVAAYIAAYIAADNRALNSCCFNLIHLMHEVNGKKQQYSGMGYCELRFNRQRFVNYYLNKQLRSLLDQYYFDDSVDLDNLVESFIDSNDLNEGWNDVSNKNDDRAEFNQLTDAILSFNTKEIVDLKMKKPLSGRNASTEVAKSEQDYLLRLNKLIDNQVECYENTRENKLYDHLTSFLEFYQKNIGFGRFPELAKRLMRTIIRMKEGLEDETSYCLGRKHEMEDGLKVISEIIDKNSSKGFLGIGNQEETQKRYIDLFLSKIQGVGTDQEPTMTRLVMDVSRKRKAISIYDNLIAIVKQYYDEKTVESDDGEMMLEVHGKSVEVRQMFDSLKSLIERDIDNYKPTRMVVGKTLYADAYFKPYFDTHINSVFDLSDTNIKDYYKDIADFFANDKDLDEVSLNSLKNRLLNHLNDESVVKKIQQEKMTIDDVFELCFGTAENIKDEYDFKNNQQLVLFNQLTKMFDVMWQYEDFRGDNSIPVNKQCIVGVYDIHSNIMNTDNGYEAYLPNNFSYHYVTVNNPDRISFMLQEFAVPAFKINDIARCETAYTSQKGHIYSFSDIRLENIKMLAEIKEQKDRLVN